MLEWGIHGQPPPPPPPDPAWVPPGSAPMDVVTPSEDSNTQDSTEFNSESRHGVYPQNSHGYGAQPDSYAMAPMAMNQFDYQVCRCYSRKCWSIRVLVWGAVHKNCRVPAWRCISQFFLDAKQKKGKCWLWGSSMVWYYIIEYFIISTLIFSWLYN